MTKYEKFAKDFMDSGLTQKAYADKIGKASWIVNYNLRKAREQKPEGFTPLEIQSGSSENTIRIVTRSGVEIEIPI